MTLTGADVKNAETLGRNYNLADAKGLFLLVACGGTKSWRFKYRFGRKEKLLTLGEYPDVGFAAARVLNEDAGRLISDGKDPVLEAQRKHDAEIDAANATFRKLASEWLADQEDLWSPANAYRVRSRIGRDLYPAFGQRSIGDIDSAMILRALRKIEARGSIETAKRVRGYILAMFKRAKAKRFVIMNTILEIDTWVMFSRMVRAIAAACATASTRRPLRFVPALR